MNNTEVGVQDLPYTKMHGLGNDFVMVSDSDLLGHQWGVELLNDWHRRGHILAKTICERHFGVGADGLILSIDPQNLYDSKIDQESQFSAYRIFDSLIENMPLEPLIGWAYLNSDGSVSSVCGNGLRCLAKFVMERGIVRGRAFLVATPVSPAYGAETNGSSNHQENRLIRVSSLDPSHHHMQDWFSVDLGEPELEPSLIPVSFQDSIGNSDARVVKQTVSVAGHQFPVTCVNMGNPHCVIFDAPFMSNVSKQLKTEPTAAPSAGAFPSELAEIAPLIQQAVYDSTDNKTERIGGVREIKMFREGVNVEFAFVHNESILIVYVWERGCGPTLACASGAAACLVAGVLEGRIPRKMTVRFGPPTPHYPNRDLYIEWCENNHVVMSGPAQEVSSGVFKFQGVSL